MPLYGAIRCHACYRMFVSQSDFAYHLTTDHARENVDEGAAYVIPTEHVERGKELYANMIRSPMLRELVAMADNVSQLADQDPLHDYWLNQVISCHIDRCLTMEATEVAKIELKYLDPMTQQQRARVIDALLYLDSLIVSEVLPAHELAASIGPVTYHRLTRFDMDDAVQSSVVLATRATLCAQVFHGLGRGREVASRLKDVRAHTTVAISSGDGLSRGLWEDDRLIDIRPCQALRSITGVVQTILTRSTVDGVLAAVLLIFKEGHRLPVALRSDGRIIGLPELGREAEWYSDALHSYVGQVVLEAMSESVTTEPINTRQPAVPRDGNAAVGDVVLSQRRYEKTDLGGRHTSPRGHSVRPHLRYVREGYKMDAAKSAHATRAGLQARTGFTLVSGHTRGLRQIERPIVLNGRTVYRCAAVWADNVIESLFRK